MVLAMSDKTANRTSFNSVDIQDLKVARSPRSRGSDRVVATDGVYSNPHFVNSVAALLGTVVKVHTATGSIYEGIFKTFSSQFEIVIELAHKVDPENPFIFGTESVVEKMIFKPQDIIKMAILDQDVDCVLKDVFQTDGAISKFNGQVTERELEPWDSSGNNADDFELVDGTTSNGWDVNEMFKKNEQMYGVTSNFDHGLSAYTTPLQKDTKDYKDAEAKAAKIANEIESTTYYKSRTEVENGDEEEKFAAVVRPSNPSSESNNEGANKYVCPPKRKTQQGSKVNRSSPASPPQPNPPKGQTAPPNYNQSHSTPSQSTRDNNPRDRDRERINGVSDNPKPQRMSNNTRHGRPYSSNNEGPRYSSNGTLPPPQNNPSISVENRNSSNSSHGTNLSYSSNAPSHTNENQHHRKPPPTIVHASNDHPSQPAISQNTSQRKLPRSREDQKNELKKFSTDMKIAEIDEQKSCTAIPEAADHSTPASARPPEPSVTEHATRSATNTPTCPPPDNATAKPAMKSKLNPNAKEFVYNPNAKPFTPRSASTPNQSRPHTPQTPGYGPPVPPMPMVMPYVVAQPPYSQPPNPNRYRKVAHMGMSQPSQMQVAAATGQPLLAPAPMHTQFTVPYSPQAHIAPQSYHHQSRSTGQDIIKMVRMVAQSSGGMPPVLTTINYPPDNSSQAQMQYMGPGGMGGPHPHHPHHPHVHPPPNNSSSPQSNNSGQMGNNSGSGGGNASSGSGGPAGNAGGPPPPQGYPPSPAGSFNQPPPTGGAPHPQNPTHTFPIMCNIIPAPPPPSHPSQHSHHMMAAAAAQSSVQQYLHHHHPHQHSSAVGSQQPHHIQVILPPSQ